MNLANFRITENEAFDKDFKLVSSITSDPEKVRTIQSVLDNPEASDEEIKACFEGCYDIVHFLLTKESMEEVLLAEATEDQIEYIQTTIENVRSSFGKLLSHPNQGTGPSLPGDDDLLDRRNTIRNTLWDIQWTIDDNKLRPEARVSFFDIRNNLVLDSTMDWDDLAKLASSLSRILNRTLQESKKIHDANLLNLQYKDEVKKSIQKAHKNLTQANEILATFDE